MVKHILDILFAILLLVILLPLFIIISLSIYSSMGLPIFFCQKRIGLNNKPFSIYKFRTMRDKNKIYITDEDRLTNIGKKLRKFRLDELPQLLNIIKGDMSFIGPRPLIPDYLPYYTKEEIRRHNVRPGLSGYSQIKSLHYLSWEQQFENDLFYVDNISFKLDFFILRKTILKILQPSVMMKSGIIGNRMNFDKHRTFNNSNNEFNKIIKK